MFKFTTPSIAHALFPQLTWRIPNNEQKIYLTFDDGPVPGATEEVLDILSTYNINATFFCVGDNVRKHPRIFKKVIEAGHQVGNHTYNHLKGWNTKNKDYLKNIADCAEAIEHAGNRSTRLFRPPYGKISMSQIRLLKDYKIIMWDVLARDFERELSADIILKKIKTHTRSGSIIVFHDSIKTIGQVKKILPEYIQFCKQSGFQFAGL